jgi:cellulose biosynthesis protein BcsQ
MMGEVITFYSYKGGTGRSLAVANVAWILASNGKKVIVIDWDLEAPGLHRYFRPFLRDPDLVSTKGLIDFVVEFALDAAGSSFSVPPSLLNFATSLEWEFGPGFIDFVPAGRQDSSYSLRVNDFPWQKFYEHLGGRRLLDEVRNELKSSYDYVLIDSRTGLADTSAICTVQMPDKLVLCFTMNSQSLQATASVAQAVRNQRPAEELRMFPVPMRVDPMEKAKLDNAREEARKYFDQFVVEQSLPPAYWGEVEVPYQPFYSYEELLAPFIDAPGSRNTILSSSENLARYLSDGAVSASIPIPESLRQEVRTRLLRQT